MSVTFSHCEIMARKLPNFGVKTGTDRCAACFVRPLRQTSGMVANQLKLAGLHWPVPDFSTLWRRQKTLPVQIPFRRADGPLNLLVPSRDIASRCPAGQWTAPTIHVAATPPSSRAAPLRSSRSEKTGGRAKKTGGRAKKIDRPHAPATTPCAARCDGRAFWTRWTGYHARGRIEAKPLIVCSQTTAGQWMRCVKLLGQRIAARDPDRQTAEIHIRIALMNRCNALGTAKIIRTA
jgi:hypothetical protein